MSCLWWRRLALGMVMAAVGWAGVGMARAQTLTQAPTQTPAQMLEAYRQASGRAPDAAQGQRFFTASHGREWRCASCHGAMPTDMGRHAASGKPIRPLAPAFQPTRFTDPAKVEKWFRRNCNDVLARACSPAEKADVLAWLMSLQPPGTSGARATVQP
jgi:hypothetical protein